MAFFFQRFLRAALCLHLVAVGSFTFAQAGVSTLPPLKSGEAPLAAEEMWLGVDPTVEPLETVTLGEWEEEGVVMRLVSFRIGVFKGEKATLAAVYGYPKGQSSLPGLVQIHGGGQYADYRACLYNAKRGYATVSIAWAGRYKTPEYQVGPEEVKRFWSDDTEHPEYRMTTDWGAVDGYHAPGRNPRNAFPNAKAWPWTVDTVESPRNSGWYLCALAGRRALTFLEQQPEVDADRLGVYGHSMGGKLTVLVSPDSRVKAAAPSCGGISDRHNSSPLFRGSLGDDANLPGITCPIVFLSPANDFHGRIGDLPRAVSEIRSDSWRAVCAPHHNHQDTALYEAVTLLWFDEHLKKTFTTPATPATDLTVDRSNKMLSLQIQPDTTMPIKSIDIYYTQHGKLIETQADRDSVVHRYWRHTTATKAAGVWSGAMPIATAQKPLWAYANVTYELPEPASGVGYYYRPYETDRFVISSLLTTMSPKQLESEGVQGTLPKPQLIEDFRGDWEQAWFSYRPGEWPRRTNKLNDKLYRAPLGARLALDVQSDQKNALVLRIDEYAAAAPLAGGDTWQSVSLAPNDFKNATGESLPGWDGAMQLEYTYPGKLKADLRKQILSGDTSRNWKGSPPRLRKLRWTVE